MGIGIGEMIPDKGVFKRRGSDVWPHRGEVAGIEWTEIDTDAAVWSMPSERTKNGRATRCRSRP